MWKACSIILKPQIVLMAQLKKTENERIYMYIYTVYIYIYIYMYIYSIYIYIYSTYICTIVRTYLHNRGVDP
jgi:uncharacterized protein YybS (DUF2232 family)